MQVNLTTLFVGQKLSFLPTCESTNDWAIELLNQQEALDGQVLWTSHQSKGRGQRGNTWITAPDQNLCFSVILMPNFLAAQEQFRLHLLVSLAILEAFSPIVPLKIKWPNDIYYQDSKLGGILIENTIQQNNIKNSVLGIGLNINQEKFELPKAISLYQITGKKYELPKLLAQVLVAIEKYYFQLKDGKFENMKVSYLQHLYRFQERHWFSSGEEVFFGQIIGIDPYGRLALEVEQCLRYFDFKEIVFLD